MTQRVIRILLVEDEPAWQMAIKALLASGSSEACLYECVGIVDNYEDGRLFAETLQPDVVLLDWQIRGEKTGLDLAENLIESGVPVEHLILVSGSPPEELPPHELQSVGKTQIATELLGVLERVTNCNPSPLAS